MRTVRPVELQVQMGGAETGCPGKHPIYSTSVGPASQHTLPTIEST